MQLLISKENQAIHKQITEIYQIIPGILLHVILGVTGKRRMRSERSWRSCKPHAQKLPVGKSQAVTPWIRASPTLWLSQGSSPTTMQGCT